MKSPEKKAIKWRKLFIWLFLALILISIVIRMLHLQLVEQKFLKRQGDHRASRTEVIPAQRGVIRDRHGEPLALTTAMNTIFVNPEHLDTRSPNWPKVIALLGFSAEQINQKLARYQDKQFMYLKRRVPPPIANQIRALRVPGVYFETEYKRFYPQAEIFAQVVGFTNIKNQGQEGIELMYNPWLSGTDGARQVVRDLKGNVLKNETLREPVAGKDITLSLDSRLQTLTYQALKAAFDKNHAESASAVILSAKTGEVLAMVSLPGFNPNNLNHIQPGATRNRAVTDMFEPGSVFKPFAMAAVLSSGKFQPEDTVDTYPGRFKVSGNIIRDPRSYGEIPLTEVIRKSSNVGISKLVLQIEPEGLPNLLRKLGIGQSPQTGFPGESPGRLAARREWQPFALATLSFGYGVAASTLQLAQAYSVIANQGQKQSLSLLKKTQVEAPETVLEPLVANQVLEMLKAVVAQGGTGVRAQIEGVPVAGKTGTSRKASNGGYADDQYTALFAGIAPADDPKYVMVVMVDNPRGELYYGGSVAAPVFKQVMARLLVAQKL